MHLAGEFVRRTQKVSKRIRMGASTHKQFLFISEEYIEDRAVGEQHIYSRLLYWWSCSKSIGPIKYLPRLALLEKM